MKRTWMMSVIVGLVLGVVGAAHAGAGGAMEVQLTRTTFTRAAQGTLLGARQSSDGTQYIGCTVERLSEDSSYLDVSCWARNAAGTTYVCRSSRATFADMALGIGPASHVYFEMDGSDSECDVLRIGNTSTAMPAPAARLVASY